MSNLLDPGKSRLFDDYDAWRAPVGTAVPTNPFGTIPAPWVPFGGIKAGITNTPDQDRNTIEVGNNKSNGPYRLRRGQRTDLVEFIAVEYTKATVLTLLLGGSISETASGSGVWQWNEGSDEEFALLIRGYDRGVTNQQVGYAQRAELSNRPPAGFSNEDIAQFTFQVQPLVPTTANIKALQWYTNWNPLA